MASDTCNVAAIVLAGGSSRRFGSDKLAADLLGQTLFDRAIKKLPPDWRVVVVGPARPALRELDFITEDPPGSGPAAALVIGARRTLAMAPSVVVSVPGDTPGGGAAARRLVSCLMASEASACVGVDTTGREQPLQLAVRDTALDRLAAVAEPAGMRARDLLPLFPDLLRVPLADSLIADIDTPADAEAWLSTRP